MTSQDRLEGVATDPIRDAVAAAETAGLFAGWDVAMSNADATFWSEYRPVGGHSPDTGFKLHLSASLSMAGQVLSRSLPILVKRGVPFKHASTLQELAFLSSGRGGLTQIGKFLAAYPPDPTAAAELAQVLHDATADLTGPRIRSEAVFAENSLVHYRYGGFARKSLQLLTGRIVPARVGRAGILEPDDRGEGKLLPATQAPLFQDQAPPDAHLLRGRYLRIQPLHQGPKGTTWLGFDVAVHDDALLVIKEAYAHVMEASDGLDARERLRQEASCLEGLRSTRLVPAFRAFWEEGRSAFLVYEFIDGRPFASVLNSLAAEGLRPTAMLLREWAGALCNLVSSVHRQGYVIGDLKPANLILTENGFRLIDLELGGRINQLARGGMGTRGYVSPQQSDRSVARSFQDDIFALGATILAAATAMDCSVLPDSLVVARLERRRDPLNPFYAVIETCLASDPAERFATIEAAADCLSAPPETAPLPADLAPLLECDFLRLAADVGNLLLGTAVRDGASAWWVSQHPIVGNLPGRDLYAGSSGTALFLCALHEATNDSRYVDLALRVATWLDTTVPAVPTEGVMPGLYFGICGPGLLFLRLYALTGEARWLDRALAIGEKAALLPAHSPDIMTGRAGTGLFHLALWRACGHRPSLDRAFHEARMLIQDRSAERPLWIIPPGHETLSGNAYLGFAHGSAGIGYFLTECCLTREDSEIARTCSTLADWFVDIGRPCLSDSSGLNWGLLADDAPGPVNWCHGAPGVVRFLLKAYELTANPAHLEAAERGARLVAYTPWHGTTQCHGLAGNADVLIDLWQHSGSRLHLDAARLLGENLAAFRIESGWPSEELSTVCPDFMIGQAGVGAAFLRLARPDMPHLICA